MTRRGVFEAFHMVLYDVSVLKAYMDEMDRDRNCVGKGS